MEEKEYPTEESGTAPVRQQMDMGLLGCQDLVFVRQFRWTLGSENLNKAFVKNVKFDHINKTIDLEAYEIYYEQTINIHDWLEKNLSEEELTFSTYDGCGEELYRLIFKNLKVLSDTSEFDYSKSNESTRKIKLSYGICQRQSIRHKAKSRKRFVWKISVNGSDANELNVLNRPNLEIEEIEINFLNSKMWLPGKAEWQNIDIIIPKKSKHIIQAMFTQNVIVKLTLHGLQDELLESWILKNVLVSSMKHEKEFTNMTLSYNEVCYEATEVKND